MGVVIFYVHRFVAATLLVLFFSAVGVADQALKAEDLPPEVKAQLQQRSSRSNLKPGLHLSADQRQYTYSSPSAIDPSTNSYVATLPRNPLEVIEVTGGHTEYSVKLLPLIPGLMKAQRIGNKLFYTTSDQKTQLRYEFKDNGVKEDIILAELPESELKIPFQIRLDPLLEARLDRKGNVLIYGPDNLLSGFISTGDDDTAARIMKARQKAPKTNLLYVIPAPFVIDGRGAKHYNIVKYSLSKDILTIHLHAVNLPLPLTIDPSIVVTTTADFSPGNDEGLISFDTDAISRARPSGGAIGTWTFTTSMITGREGHTSVYYNGYLYVIGGYTGPGGMFLNTVHFAAVNSNGTLGGWTATTSFTTARNAHSSVVYNGYLYVIGGYDGSEFADVQFATINSNGTLGTWTATTSIPALRSYHSSVAYNGYVYVLGGGAWSPTNTVWFAPFKANGTIGAWTSTTSFANVRRGHTSVTYNGYIYVIGGTHFTHFNDVQYAPVNADGTLGTWNTTSSFTLARYEHSSVVTGGYLYIIGGRISGGSGFTTTVQFARINANGSIGSWTSTAAFTTERSGHTSIAAKGYLFILGGIAGGFANTDTQSALIKPHGDVSSWAATTTFWVPRSRHASVAYNGYLYMIGGLDTFPREYVDFAPINSDGSIGAWTGTASVGFTGRYGHAAVAYNGYMYVTGGYTGINAVSVFYSAINANGTLAGFNLTTSFTTGRQAHTSVAHNGFLYVIGGLGATNLSDVQYAPINADGTVGAWTATTSLPTTRDSHTSFVYNGFVYCVGGYGTNYLTEVRYAQINANGTLGVWNSTTALPLARGSHTSVVYNGYIYVMGGFDGNYLNDVLIAALNANGTIGNWVTTSSFPTARYGHTTVAYDGYIYMIGGFNGNNLDAVHFAAINTGGSLGSWNAIGTFPTARIRHASVAYNGFLYVLGGFNGSYLNDVQYAPINSNGSVGTWNPATSFTTGRQHLTAVVHKGFMYVIGGYGGSYMSDVQYAPINANGTLGTWNPTTSFTTGRYIHTSAVSNGRLYVIGGFSGTNLNDVQFAPLNNNGTVGAWTTTTPFNTPRSSHCSVAYNGFLYVIGGFDGTNYLKDVQFAVINSNGTLGAWTNTRSLPAALINSSAIAYAGFLYIIGGFDGLNFSKSVQFAPIHSDGHLALWNTTSSLPTARSQHSTAAANGYFYLLGGNDGGPVLGDVHVAHIETQYPKASYSKLLDLGSNHAVSSVQMTNTATSKGATDITHALAPASTAVFGARTTIPDAASATNYANGLTCGRYIWLRFDMDDGRAATTNGAANLNRENLLSFTVTYTPFSGIGNNVSATKLTQVHLTWPAASGAAQYNVKRCLANAGPCTPVTIGTVSGLVWDDTVLANGNTYWYAIEAVNGTCVAP